MTIEKAIEISKKHIDKKFKMAEFRKNDVVAYSFLCRNLPDYIKENFPPTIKVKSLKRLQKLKNHAH